MSKKTLFSVLGMVLIAVLSVGYMRSMGLPVATGTEMRTAKLRVDDSNGIVVGSKVLLRGIEIGTVTDVESSVEGIVMSLDYDTAHPIPVDSRFRIESLSALGEAFVAVLPETSDGPYLGADALIDDDSVIDPTPFPEFSQRLTVLLQQVDPEAVRSIFDILDLGLPDASEVPADLERAGEMLAATFIDNGESVQTILRTIQPLLLRSEGIPDDLAESVPYLKDFGTGFSGVLDGVRFATIRGPLTSISAGAAPLLTQLQHFLDVNAADLETIGVSILPGVTAGAAGMRSIDVAALLDRALGAVEDGAVTVELTPPGSGR